MLILVNTPFLCYSFFMKKYDYLIVGSGLYGATCAYGLTKKGYKCLVLERRSHIGGNCYTEVVEGVNVHKYGAHIFHTSDREVWDFVNGFAEFNNYINSPIARYKNECYNLPFNMNTFTKLWDDVFTPDEAMRRIESERGADFKEIPANLEEQAINLVGRTIYEKLIKGYTEKQWGRPCSALPASIIQRLPVRFTFDNNYFNDMYQGVPVGGYTKLIEKMLEGIEVRLNCDFLDKKNEFSALAGKIVYTGAIDEFYGYSLGALEYRSLKFETEILDIPNFQGNAVVNYTADDVPFTRIIEHKHFEFGTQKKTVISREYSFQWKLGEEPYYPVNDLKNNNLYKRYAEMAQSDGKIIFGGRLGLYKYFDMDDTIRDALDFLKTVQQK